MKIQVELHGQKEVIDAEIIDGQLWFKFKNDTFVFDVTSGPKRKKKAGSTASGQFVVAPMPGKVTKIFCQVGQSVKKSQPVLVMEAMKMEYTLKADIDSIVYKLGCQIGDQVKLGQTLVEFEATKAMPASET